MAKLTGRFVCLESSAHDVAEGAMRGQAMPRVEAELLVNPYSTEIRIRSLRLDGDQRSFRKNAVFFIETLLGFDALPGSFVCDLVQLPIHRRFF
jgi:hypothetical protein